MKNIYKRIIATFTITASMLFAVPQIAMADGGYAGGGGSGGPSAESKARLYWHRGSADGSEIYEKGTQFNEVPWESLADYIKRTENKNDSYISKINSFVCVYGRVGKDPSNRDKYTNHTVFEWGSYGNWGWWGDYLTWDYFPDKLRDPKITGLRIAGNPDHGVIISDITGRYKYISAIWARPELEWVDDSDEKSVYKLIYLEDGGTVKINYPYNNEEQLKKIYEEAPTEGDYNYKTPPNKTVDKHTVKAHFLKITRTKKWKKNILTGEIKPGSEITKYTSSDYTEFARDINYTTKAPSLPQVKQRPFNLNRNGLATKDDIDTTFSNAARQIEADINNNQGITNNSYLTALDTNQDISFLFKFKNNSFGMYSGYKWTNVPGKLANRTYEYVTGSAYANGRNNNADQDGALRYNLKFYASVSSNTQRPSINSSSLLIGNEEKLAGDFYQKNLNPGAVAFSGGNWSTRFTYTDRYTTDNNQTNTKYKNWWITKYNQARFYEYGTEYWGKVNIGGINDPYKISKGSGSSDGTNYKITVDANKNERGLYVAMMSKSYEQPILYGKWDVKTIAGSVN